MARDTPMARCDTPQSRMNACAGTASGERREHDCTADDPAPPRQCADSARSHLEQVHQLLLRAIPQERGAGVGLVGRERRSAAGHGLAASKLACQLRLTMGCGMPAAYFDSSNASCTEMAEYDTKRSTSEVCGRVQAARRRGSVSTRLAGSYRPRACSAARRTHAACTLRCLTPRHWREPWALGEAWCRRASCRVKLSAPWLARLCACMHRAARVPEPSAMGWNTHDLKRHKHGTRLPASSRLCGLDSLDDSPDRRL